MWQVFLGFISQHLGEVLLTVFTALILPLLIRLILANTTAKHQEAIGTACEWAYLLVEQISRKTPNTNDDKLALALKILNDELKVKLSKKDVAKATVVLKAIHERSRPADEGIPPARFDGSRRAI